MALSFGVGMMVGAAWGGGDDGAAGCGNNNVNINVNNNFVNNSNRNTNINGGNQNNINGGNTVNGGNRNKVTATGNTTHSTAVARRTETVRLRISTAERRVAIALAGMLAGQRFARTSLGKMAVGTVLRQEPRIGPQLAVAIAEIRRPQEQRTAVAGPAVAAIVWAIVASRSSSSGRGFWWR